MKLFQVQYFCAACVQGNITKAAELLHVSQPAVSAAIRALEDEFGCRLIEHNSRGFVLTEEGRYFYQRASQILTSSNELGRDMNILAKKGSVVRIGASPMAAGRILPSIYQMLPQEGAKPIHLQILECGGADILEMLQTERLDFALIPVDRLIENMYEVMEIGIFEVVLAVPTDHPLAEWESVSIEELRGVPLIYFDENGIFSARINAAFEQYHVQPNIQCFTSQVYTIRKFVAHGVALSFLFEGIAQEAPDICGISLNPPIKIRIGLVWQKQKNLHSASKRFLKHMENFSYLSAAPETAGH